jgi:hypothetical protein
MEMVILGCWNISNKRDRKKIKNERASIFDWNGRSSAFMHLDRGKNPCLHEKYSGQKGKKTPV